MLTPKQKKDLVSEMLLRGYSDIGAANEANGINAERYYHEYCNKKIQISDLFIGDFNVSQRFGSNPASYKKFGLKGHNGVDFACPSDTPLIACADGIVYIAAFDVNGYGNYVYIWDSSQKTMFLYAHLKSFVVKKNQSVRLGQLIGYSDNTGNSTGPHLHFSPYKTDERGERLDRLNGYGGAIDALDKNLVDWNIRNPKKPL